MNLVKLAVVLGFGALLVSHPAAHAGKRGEGAEMERILERVESDDFIREVSTGSDIDFDASVLVKTPEFHALLQCDEECLGAAEARARRLLKKSRWRQRVLNVYFVLFERRSYVPGIPLICEYLDSLQDSEICVWALGCYAFTHGFDAIERITGAKSSRGALHELFRVCDAKGRGLRDLALFTLRHEIVRATLEWYGDLTSPGATPRLCPKCKSPVKAGKKFCTKDGTPVP